MVNKYVMTVWTGIGNQIQSLSLYLQFVKKFKHLDIMFPVHDEYKISTEFYNIITGYFGNKVVTHATPKDYQGQLNCVMTRPIPGVPVVATASTGCVNEEERNMYMGRLLKLGNATYNDDTFFSREVLPIDWEKFRKDGMWRGTKADVIICNGGWSKPVWLKKKYAHWCEVARILKDKGLEVWSVGNPNEYIYGCNDGINMDLLRTFDAISQCKVFAGNCSGLVHFASAIGIPTVVALTATNDRKNYNPTGLHRFCKLVMTHDCMHRPCQDDNWRLNEHWLNCKDWRCTTYDPQLVVDAILEKLEGN
jgi:hypothetical protein